MFRRLFYVSAGIALVLLFVSFNVTPSNIQPKRSVPLIDQVIREYGTSFGGETLEAAVPYKNHCYRVFNFALRAFPRALSQREEDLLAIAIGFHDIGLWTQTTLDYLKPSAELAEKWMRAKDAAYTQAEINAVKAMIEYHHKITAYHGDHEEMVERVRQGDWVDVTFGLRSFAINPSDIRAIRETFPAAGFFFNLVKWELWWLQSGNVLDPVPYMRF